MFNYMMLGASNNTSENFPTAGLMEFWDFSSLTGVNGNTLTLSGVASIATGRLVGGENANDVAIVPYTILDTLTDFTVGAWCQIDTLHAGANYYISGARAGNDNAFFIGYENSSSKWVVCLNGTEYVFAVNTAIKNLGFHHVAITRSGTVAKLYVDKILIDTITVNATAIDIDSGGLVLLQEQDTTGGGFQQAQCWAGKLDNLFIYNRALTQSEVNTIADYPVATTFEFTILPSTVLYVRFKEGSGTLIEDESGLGHSGTLDDTTLWNASDGLGTTTTSLGSFGANDEVNFGDNSDFEGFSDFTIRFYGRITNINTYGTLFRKMGSVTGDHVFYVDYYDFAPFNKNFIFAIYAPSGTSVLAQYSTNFTAVADEKFYLGISWNATTKTLIFYKANAITKGILTKTIYAPSGSYLSNASDWTTGGVVNTGSTSLLYGNSSAGDTPFPSKGNRVAIDKNYSFTESQFLADAIRCGF